MISIRKGAVVLKTKTMLFPAGEVGVWLDWQNYKFRDVDGKAVITARPQSSKDVMELVMMVDAFRETFRDEPLHLFMPYVPYARQDRVCVPGESFSLRAFASIINGLDFASITIADPHSDVCAAALYRPRVVTQVDILHRFDAFQQMLRRKSTGVCWFVAPDAGSNKKIAEVCKYFDHFGYVRADKKRNLADGKILSTEVYGDVIGITCVIVDDICDGGRTFIELAKVLKKQGAAKVILYVTHGIFSKGTKPLFEGGIDEIYSTNSFYDVWPAGVDNVTTFDIETLFR